MLAAHPGGCAPAPPAVQHAAYPPATAGSVMAPPALHVPHAASAARPSTLPGVPSSSFPAAAHYPAQQQARLHPSLPGAHPHAATMAVASPSPRPVPSGAQLPSWPTSGTSFAVPAPPVGLTAGMPDLNDISRQKEERKHRLDDQLKQGEDILSQQAKRQSEYMRLQAEQQKALATGQCDQQLRVEEIALEQQLQRQMEELHEAARRQKLQLHKQAADLVLEYNSRRAQEEINHRQYEIQLQHWEADYRGSAEMARAFEERRLAQLDLSQSAGLGHLSRMRQGAVPGRVSAELPEFSVDRWLPHQPGYQAAHMPQAAYPQVYAQAPVQPAAMPQFTHPQGLYMHHPPVV